MKAVLLSTDLIKKTDGSIKVLETNTNSWLSTDWNLYDFSSLISFIQSNNFTEVHVIVPSFIQKASIKLKEICDGIGVTHVEHILSNDAVTIPFIEDSENKLILRLSYDTTAIIDDDYCRDKFKLQSIIHNELFGVKTYISGQVDDFSGMEDFTYTDDVPNFIVKYRFPSYIREELPKLYKVQNLTQLNNLKSQLEENNFLQEFVQSDLVDGRRNIIRSLDFLYGGNLDVINISSYIILHQIEETIWPNTFDENGLLSKKDRPKYITHTSDHRSAEVEYVYDVDNEVAMGDGTKKTFATLKIGDSVKSLHIEGLDLNESLYDMNTWTGSYSEFIQNVSIVNTSVKVTRESVPISQLYIKITLDDNTSWDDVKKSLLLVKDGDIIKFQRVNNMNIGDVIITYNFQEEQIQLKTITNLEVVFKENQILGSLDVEPNDLYLPYVSLEYSIIQHNKCSAFCNSYGCANSTFCGDCTFAYCNK
jgi:hypothetical protein